MGGIPGENRLIKLVLRGKMREKKQGRIGTK